MARTTGSEIDDAFADFEGELPDSVDRAAIDRMQAVAKVLDEGMRLPGTDFRFGIDPIIGILPGAGDSVTSLVSLYIVAESARLGVSRSKLLRMLGSIAVDFVAGSVPVLGVVFDAFWKQNKWNVKMALEDLAVDEGSGMAPSPKQVDID